MALVLHHQTVEEFKTRLREHHRNAVGDDAIRSAAYMVAAIQRGDLTDVEMRTKFGLTAGQWTLAKNRMINLVNARNAIRGAVGE